MDVLLNGLTSFPNTTSRLHGNVTEKGIDKGDLIGLMITSEEYEKIIIDLEPFLLKVALHFVGSVAGEQIE